MSEREIKVGDLVRLSDTCGPVRGLLGIVREVHEYGGVAWGYAVDVDDDPVPDGMPWEMEPHEVELVES